MYYTVKREAVSTSSLLLLLGFRTLDGHEQGSSKQVGMRESFATLYFETWAAEMKSEATAYQTAKALI